MIQKKAQMKIMESIAILLIFFIIVAIGFAFYINISYYSQGEKSTKQQELDSIMVAQAASFFPEVQCSSKNVVTEDCFDSYKLDAVASNKIGNLETYYDLFKFSNISVKTIYSTSSQKSWVLYERTTNNSFYVTNVPVAVKDPVSKQYSFALLTIKTYQP